MDTVCFGIGLFLIISVKKIMFSVALICLSVCKQHYSKNYEWIVVKFMEGFGVVKGTSDLSLAAIQITMLTAQPEIRPLLDKL